MHDIFSPRLRGIVWYEFKMRLRSWTYWIVLGLLVALALFVPTPLNYPGPNDAPCFALDGWRAGQAFGILGMLTTLLVIFVTADRIVRDSNLRVKEVLLARPIREIEYVLGKYLGIVFALLLIPLAVLVGTPLAKYAMLSTGMDPVPLGGAFLLYLLPLISATAITLAGATLIKSPRTFYAIYGVLWYISWTRMNEFQSPWQTLLDIRGMLPLEALFKPAITCWGKPSPMSIELVVLNVIAILVASGGLLTALTYLERRRRTR